MKTNYTINQKPSYISFICPACGATNTVDWEDVLADDEYDKWHGDIDPISCEECDCLIYFDGCEID
ncbi:hypothetical protein ACGCUP_00975 [Eubacteriales bacterium KG125]